MRVPTRLDVEPIKGRYRRRLGVYTSCAPPPCHRGFLRHVQDSYRRHGCARNLQLCNSSTPDTSSCLKKIEKIIFRPRARASHHRTPRARGRCAESGGVPTYVYQSNALVMTKQHSLQAFGRSSKCAVEYSFFFLGAQLLGPTFLHFSSLNDNFFTAITRPKMKCVLRASVRTREDVEHGALSFAYTISLFVSHAVRYSGVVTSSSVFWQTFNFGDDDG
jgi:hypothetical protein